MDAVATLIDQSCLTYSPEDRPHRRAEAVDLLAATPALSQDPYAAACTGDLTALRRALDADPSLATTAGGPRDWVPLLYLCYSRVGVPDAQWLACAQALLDAGADPDAHWEWGGQYHFSALTGLFGEGEMGPVNQPEHPACHAIAPLLLRAGADPNDAQALYNRMFTPGSRCLELLLAHGLSPARPLNWTDCDGTPTPGTTLHYQLMFACHEGHADRIPMLLAAGVDPNEPAPDGKLPWSVATIGGHQAIATLLETHGATPQPLDPADLLAGACRANDRSTATALATPEAVAALLERHPEILHAAAKAKAFDTMQLLLDLGVDIDGKVRAPALHEALWDGSVEGARWLLDHGADPTITDTAFGGDALGWARHGGHADTIALIEAWLARR